MPPNIGSEAADRATLPLRARLRRVQERVMARPATGHEAGKAFYDALSGDGFGGKAVGASPATVTEAGTVRKRAG